MKGIHRSPYFPWAVLAGGVIAVALFLPIASQHDVCRTCIARRFTKQYPIRTSVRESGSEVLSEVFGGTHVHAWSFSNSRSWRAISCGSPLGNPIAHFYKNDAAFRALVQRHLSDGSLRREDLVAYLEIPMRPSPEFRTASGSPDTLSDALALARECETFGQVGFMFRDWTDRRP